MWSHFVETGSLINSRLERWEGGENKQRSVIHLKISVFWGTLINPGDPVVKIPHSQCRGLGFDSWSGTR